MKEKNEAFAIKGELKTRHAFIEGQIRRTNPTNHSFSGSGRAKARDAAWSGRKGNRMSVRSTAMRGGIEKAFRRSIGRSWGAGLKGAKKA